MKKPDRRAAEKIRSRDNSCEELYGTIFFGVRKHKKFDDEGKEYQAEKQAVQCAIDYARKMHHEMVVKIPRSPKDHWYGSYEKVDDFTDQVKKYQLNFFEIVTLKHPKGDLDGVEKLARFFHADIEYDPATLIRPANMPVPTDKEVVDNLNEYICAYASDLCGHEVSRKVEIGASTGNCADPKWQGIDKKSFHDRFFFGFADHDTEFAFKTALHNRIMQEGPPNLTYVKTEIDKSSGAEVRVIKSIFDPAPYQKNQSWRCLYSMKPEDTDPRRALRPIWGSSDKIKDHLVGIYTAEQRAMADILSIELMTAASRKAVTGKSVIMHVARESTDDPVEFKFIPHELLERAVDNLSFRRVDDRETWIRLLWCLFNICNKNQCYDLGLRLAHLASSKSPKYDSREVDAIWASTAYMPSGLQWPSLRSWLYEDNRSEWQKCCSKSEWKPLMTRDNRLTYVQQYKPDPAQYAKVITDFVEYKERAVPAFDLKLQDVIIDHSPMDTRKTNRIVELILSGKFRSIVIWVNRQTLTRASIQRINFAICKKLGRFDPDLCFRDYRRPDEVINPFTRAAQMSHVDGARVHKDSVLDDREEDEVADPIPQPVSTIDLSKYPFIVMQMESGWKLKGPAPALCVVEECESDLAQFSSSTMRQTMGCSDNFKYYVQNSKKVIFLDAFISNKTLEVVCDFFYGHGKRVQYRHNKWLPEGKRSFQIEGKSSASVKKNMTDAILAKLKLGQRAVLFTSSNKFGCALAKAVVEKLPDKVVFLYNKFTDGKIRDEHFDNLDAVWQHADLVIYSPILLAGPSVNILVFDCCFVFGYNESCCVRDMFQAAGRVRNFKDQTMYYALDSFSSKQWSLPTTFEGVKANVAKEGAIVKKYLGMDQDMRPCNDTDPEGQMLLTIDEMDLDSPAGVQNLLEQARRVKADRAMRKLPSWFLDVHVRNTWETYLTHNPASFQTVFEDFLKMTGWYHAGILTKVDIANWENSARKEIGEPQKQIRRAVNSLSNVNRDYLSIEDIDEHARKYLNQKRAVGLANTEELLALQKWWFDNEIVKKTEGTSDARARVFNSLNDRPSMDLLLNITAEAHLDIESEYDTVNQSNPFEDLIQEAEKRLTNTVIMKKICAGLGLRSTYDVSRQIEESVLHSKQKELEQLIQDFHVLNPQVGKSSSSSSKATKKLHLNINKLLGTFSRSKLRSKHYGKNMDHIRYFIEISDKAAQDIISFV